MVRYGLGSNSYFLWGDEGTPYTLAATRTKNFGLITEDVRPPNPNTKTPLATVGGKRGPHVWARDQNEFSFDLPFHVQHADAPFHVALGQKTVSSVGGGAPYTKTLFEEAKVLPTISVEHGSADLGILQQFIGTKGSLRLSCAKGESLKANLGLMAAKEDHDTTSPALQTPSIPTNEPFRFSHIQWAKFFQPGTSTLVKDIVTLDSFDFGWNPGLEAVPHGGSGREAYSVVEAGDPAGLYDMKIGITADGADFFEQAADDEATVDLEVALARTVGVGGVLTDAAIIRLQECTVLEAPAPVPAAGRIRLEVPLGPRDTEIELRTPA